MQSLIEVNHISKSYGKKTIINDISFTVNAGEVYALVGPNGAGKTTIIRLVTGLSFPSAGDVKLFGEDASKKPNLRRKLGAVVEAPAAFYPYLSGEANLKLHAKLAGGVKTERIAQVLKMMELSYAKDQKVATYSLGMRQRLGVAAAVLTEPEILILDEPASGMDPLSLHLVHSVLQNAAQNGAAVLLSTHHLDEVVTYCSRVAILEEGKLIDEVNLHDRRQRYKIKISDPQRAEEILADTDFVRHIKQRGDELVLILAERNDLAKVTATLFEHNISIYELMPDRFNLKAYYREQIHINPNFQNSGVQR